MGGNTTAKGIEDEAVEMELFNNKKLKNSKRISKVKIHTCLGLLLSTYPIFREEIDTRILVSPRKPITLFVTTLRMWENEK